jgi:hypothetical protein
MLLGLDERNAKIIKKKEKILIYLERIENLKQITQ